VIVVLGPLVAAVWALGLWRGGGRGGGGRFCPAGARVLADGRHLGGALHHLPVADVLVAVHVHAVPRPVIRRMVQIYAKMYCLLRKHVEYYDNSQVKDY